MRNLDREHEEARDLTARMRQSDDPVWVAVRSFLGERSLGVTRCAIGVDIPEENGPFLVLVDSDRRAYSFEVQRVRKSEPLEVVLWRELHDDRDRFAYSWGIFAAMVLLDAERPSDSDPMDVLVGSVREATRPFRANRLSEHSMHPREGFWTVVHAAIADHGHALAQVAVLDWTMGTDGVELGLVLSNGSAVDVGGSLDTGWARVTEVTCWRELAPAEAVAALGELVAAGRAFLALT
jgi:hypothetical protein